MLTFKHSFTSKTGQVYDLVPLTESDIDAAAALIAKAFSTQNPISVCLQCKEEDYFRWARNQVIESIRSHLGIACRERSTSKLVGVAANCDYYELKKKQFDYSDYSKEFQNCLAFFKEIAPVVEVANPHELILMNGGAVDPLYANQNIISQITDFIVKKHPLSSRAERLFVGTPNPYTAKLFLSDPTFERIKFYDPRTYVTQDGRKLFENFDETLKTLKMEGFEGISYFIRDTKKTFNRNSKL